MSDTFIALDASPSLFGSRQQATSVLESWLRQAAPKVERVSIDLVSDFDNLPAGPRESREYLESLRRPAPPRFWRRPSLDRLPTVDLKNERSLVATAGYAYWSIDVQIVYQAERYVEFFSAADSGEWATYNLPGHEVNGYLSAFPASVHFPDSWRELLS